MLSDRAVYFKKLLMNTLDCTASDLASEVVGGQYDPKVASFLVNSPLYMTSDITCSLV